MQVNELYSRLNILESQKQSIEQEILETKKIIEKSSPFSKQQKISLFKSLFVAREDVYPTYWISKDGTKKGYSPATFTFRGQDYIPIDDCKKCTKRATHRDSIRPPMSLDIRPAMTELIQPLCA